MNTDNSSKTYGRLDVTIPDATYEAGRISTVRILLRNPFDEPVEILEIKGPRSSHIQEAQKEYMDLAENQNMKKTPENGSHKGEKKISDKILSTLSGVSFSGISFGGIEVEFPRQKKTLNIKAAPKSEIDIDTDVSAYESINVQADEDSTVKFRPQPMEKKPDETQVITIEPHCEAVAYFQVSTSGWLFFTPTRQTLSTQIRYKIKGNERTQVVSSGFDIKPPLKAMVVGSMIGAFLGTLAKTLNSIQFPSYKIIAVSIGASIVMSLIATIALARKTGTQGFITVEDFFGGFVVGALIGYGGSEYFEKAIMPPAGG